MAIIARLGSASFMAALAVQVEDDGASLAMNGELEELSDIFVSPRLLSQRPITCEEVVVKNNGSQ